MKWLIEKNGWIKILIVVVVVGGTGMSLCTDGRRVLPADCYGSGYNKICD